MLCSICCYRRFPCVKYVVSCYCTSTVGGYLVRCGEVESKIGMSEKKYQDKVNVEVVVPLRSFLEVDIKNVLVSCTK